MVKEGQLERLENEMREIEQFVSNYTFPLFACLTENSFELFSSCISVLIHGKKYLCTASHAVENLLKTKLPVAVGLNGTFSSIDLEHVTYFIDPDIDYDICLIPFEYAPEDTEFFPHDCFHGTNELEKGTKQYLHGFSISKNKYYNLHDHKNEKISTGHLRILIKVDQKLKHQFKSVSATTHLFFRYNGGAHMKTGGTFNKAKKGNMPSLVGLSGSGIWSISNINDTSSVKLAGIFNQFTKGIGSGVKISIVTDK